MIMLEWQGVCVLSLFHKKESDGLHGKSVHLVGARLTMPPCLKYIREGHITERVMSSVPPQSTEAGHKHR